VLWGHYIQQLDDALDWMRRAQNPAFAFINEFDFYSA
jgi:hypothetical protein